MKYNSCKYIYWSIENYRSVQEQRSEVYGNSSKNFGDSRHFSNNSQKFTEMVKLTNGLNKIMAFNNIVWNISKAHEI